MKRSPLKRGTSQLKRTPLRSISLKRQAESRKYAKLKKAAFAELAVNQRRPGETPFCEVCASVPCFEDASHFAQDWHHWHPVGQGGPYIGGKMFCVCRRCHDWIHQNPAPARKGGWLK